jgi:LacI family transcriptional regulator
MSRRTLKMTSHDLAREVGVSQSTVSRALRGDPRVDPSTAARVVSAAERFGYAPNASARSLVTQRTGTVALVLSDITNPFYPQLVEELHAQFGRAGYRMALFNERTRTRGDGGLEMLLNTGAADGAVFMSVTNDDAGAELVSSSSVPAVLLNRDVAGPLVDRVLADHRGGAIQVAEMFVDLGHTRIGFIGGIPNTSTSSGRETGLRAGLASRGLSLDPALCRSGDFTHQAGFQWTTELLSGDNPPTAIFCANDVIAFGALDATRRLRLDVPGQVSVAGFDDIPMAGWDSFSLTTVRQPLTEMAREAARLLISRIEGSDDDREPSRIVFPNHLVSRGTTGPAPSVVSR